MNAGNPDVSGMTLPALAASNVNASNASEDSFKKIRKPYTITKSRESWTDQEHDKFIEALHLFDRDWKKIEAFVGTKSVIQIRSHAQKYFLKVQKNGSGEHVPPPRPKRKSAQPYPQKAAKSAPLQPSLPAFHPTSAVQSDLGYPSATNSCMPFSLPVTVTPTPSSWVHSVANLSDASLNGNAPLQPSLPMGLAASTVQSESSYPSVANSCAAFAPSVTGTLTAPPWVHHATTSNTASLDGNVTPDFAEIYTFLGDVFDHNTTDHFNKLKEMAPINRETILLLMRNLSINLSNPDFEEQKPSLSVCDMNMMQPRGAVTGHA